MITRMVRAAVLAAGMLPALLPAPVLAQGAAGSGDSSPASSPPEPLTAYIEHSWDALRRSMTECGSVVDPKVTKPSVLYLPAGIPEPPEVSRMAAECRVSVLRLPAPVVRFGQLREKDFPQPGLLYLPRPYVVPGGRFNEMYGWDSYFILLGLLRDGRLGQARDMVENFFFEIEHYGGLLNANRTYYFTRSQPPLLSSMVRAIYAAAEAGAGDPAAREREKAWLRRAYGFLSTDYSLWTSEIHRAGDTGLARYFDIGEGPVPEMADDSTYYPDAIRWLLGHPEVRTDYLVDGPERPTPAEIERMAALSCDAKTSEVCARAHVDGHWLSRDFYRGDRAMRESGFDTSFRYGPYSGSTHHFADVGLNSLLYKYEQDMAYFAGELGRARQAGEWRARARTRRAAIDRYLWNPERGLYFDWDYMARRPSTYVYATTFYPLWAGASACRQADAVAASLGLLEKKGGLAMSATESGAQWDAPYGWAPVNWLAAEGLARSGHLAEARRLAGEFMRTVEENYQRDHTVREKYDVENASANVAIAAGYKQNVIGFGWTNGVYLEMRHLLEAAPDSACGGGR